MQTARGVAADILLKIQRDGAYGNILLRNALDALPEPRERAFATELVNGCLRNLIYLDHVIGSVSSVPVSKLKPVILSVLRAGAYQILLMERVPAPAAIDEAVKDVRRRGFGNLAGFVNAVLRNISRKAGENGGSGEASGFSLPDPAKEPLRRLSVGNISRRADESGGSGEASGFGLPDPAKEPLRRLSVGNMSRKARENGGSGEASGFTLPDPAKEPLHRLSVGSISRRAGENGGSGEASGFGLPDPAKEPLRRLSVEYSVPLWIVETLAFQRGLEGAAAFCRGCAGAPYVGLCVNTLKTDRRGLTEILREEGAEIIGEAFHGGFVSVTGFSGIAERESFRAGLYHVMDPGAAAPVDMLGPEAGDEILDMCAAPGGKAFYAAYKMAGKGRVTAWDIHPRKAGLISEAAKRLGTDIVKPETADATKPPSSRKYGKILLDAPCSGLGVLKKKPDIRYSLKKEDIAPLTALQRGLLASAAGLCAPGGIVVYSTCTVNAGENEENARWFAENYGFEIQEESQTFPGAGMDGFYSVRLGQKRI